MVETVMGLLYRVVVGTKIEYAVEGLEDNLNSFSCSDDSAPVLLWLTGKARKVG